VYLIVGEPKKQEEMRTVVGTVELTGEIKKTLLGKPGQ
jgi:hypothetical protein